MQRSTDGRPAYSERRASAWQYWHSILYCWTCTTCGNAIGWTDGLAMAGWRLHEDTAKNISTARRTTAAAPTPAFRIDSRLSSWGLGSAREPYHLPRASVNDNSPSRDGGERLRRGAPGGIEVGLGVRQRDERRLELRGCQIHAALA